MNNSSFSQKIAKWYHAHKRDLPWRETTDPYQIWLSEVILQQTRVGQGLPYYLKFIEHYPDVIALAHARERDILRLWQGLGYYTRARNLHRCAKMVTKYLHGKFPDSVAGLRKLPGIGPYTAAAIASIAFRQPVAVVDGNVYRVLARVFGIEKNIATRDGKDYFLRKAQALISKEHPDIFNQAMMEFGATHCLPRNPKCDVCIFKGQCIAFAKDRQDRLPVRNKKPKVRKRYFYYFVIRENKRLLMRKRSDKDIWQGLYDFYLVETKQPQRLETIFRQDGLLKNLHGKIQVHQISVPYKHVLTHQHLLTRFIPVEIKSSKADQLLFKSRRLKFYSSKEINKLPKPVLVSGYLKESDFL